MKPGAFLYFALTFVWSFVFWSASALLMPGLDPGASPLFLVGGAGPFLVAIALVHLRETPTVRRSYWRRTFDPRLIRGAWWVPTLLLHPALVAMAFVVDLALGGRFPELPPAARAPGALLSLAFFTFWFGPLPEEMGWRGFALDRLQRRMNALAAGLLLGTVWAAWHLPLFFIPRTFQEGLGLGSPRSLIFLYSMVPLSVLMSWVYNNTNGSTLSAVLIHYTGNLCGALLPKTDRVAALEALFLTLAAIVVVRRSDAANLAVRGGAGIDAGNVPRRGTRRASHSRHSGLPGL